MQLIINNKLSFKNAFIVTLDKNYDVVSERKIEKGIQKIDINLDIEKFLYYTNKRVKSEVIILSNNLNTLDLLYCKETKNYKFDLQIENCNEYGKVFNYSLKDEKNLFYRQDKSKNINIYVPNSYDGSKPYNVLVMFDSQNIFHKEKVGNYTDKNDPYGSWQVETSLKYKYDNYIVVGIENADEYRESELSFDDEELKAPLGIKNGLHLDNLDDFINETLLPFVKSKFNVLTANMGICGASCGGLASLYVGLKNYNKYDFVFSFTAALGILGREGIEKLFRKYDFNNKKLPYVFLFQGLADDLEKLLHSGNQYIKTNMIKMGYLEELIDEYIEKDAKHNEDAWRYAFNYALEKYMNISKL